MIGRASRALAFALSIFAAGLTAAVRADAQDVERFALVIGNSAYTEPGWSLAAPANDAALAAEALEAVGFEVELLADADGQTMDSALRAFAERLDKADPRPAAVFYFAGHAASSRGETYLFPVDLTTEGEEIHADALHLDDVIARFRRAGEGKGFIVIDACAAPVDTAPEPASACGPLERPRGSNALVAFSAGVDERTPPAGESGLYAQALADALTRPALEGDEVFAQVGRAVAEASGGAQHPWAAGGEGGEAFYFVPPAPSDFETRVAESVRWDFARRSDTPDAYRGYVAAHPDGRFVSQALARVEREEAPDEQAEPPAAASAAGLIDVLSSALAASTEALQGQPSAQAPAAPPQPAKFRSLDPEDLLLMETTKGRLLIELLPELAPGPVARMRELARERFFDGAPFNRVVDGLFAEAALRPLAPSSSQPRELLARAEPPATPVDIADRDRGRVGVYADGDVAFGMYKGVAVAASGDDPADEWIALCPGVLAAGTSADGSADASFAIMLGEAPALDSDAEVWGRVIHGLEVLYDLAVGDALSPGFEPDRMTRVRVVADLSEREAGEIYAAAGAVLDETGPGFAEFTASLSETLGREPRLCEIRLPIVGGAAPGLLPPAP